MSNSLTISQILSPFSKIDKAFWASYSIDFHTLDFIIRMDLQQIMSLCYLHTIVDFQQFESSLAMHLEERRDINKIRKLQEYCTFSTVKAQGAFHPKILLLASETEVHVVAGSANLTSAGILSNQDLVSVFSYSRENTQFRKEVSSFLAYLGSLDDWCEEAIEDLSVVLERFPELNVAEKSRVFFTPSTKSLLDEMFERVTNFDYSAVICYSPFFDKKLQALQRISSEAGIEILAVTPQENVPTTLQELPKGVVIKSAKGANRSSFHAKFYEFRGKNTSKIFWGSANCSYSGLLSSTRNYEFLIEDDLDNELVDSLWEATSSMQNAGLTAFEEPEDMDNSGELYLIQNVRIEEDRVFFKTDCLKGKRLIGTNGIESYKVALTINESIASFEDDLATILFWFENESAIRNSNIGYINRPNKISNRLLGESEVKNSPDIEKQDRNAFRSIFKYFNFPTVTKSPSKKSKSAGIGFWRMPRYSRQAKSVRLIDLRQFISNEVNKIKERRDNDETNEDDNSPPRKTEKRSTHANQPVLEFIARETSKLKNSIPIIESKKLLLDVDWSQWKKGLELLLSSLLRDMLILEHMKTDEAKQILFDLSVVTNWIFSKNNSEFFGDDLNQVLYLFAELSSIQYAYDLNVTQDLDPLNKERMSNIGEKLKILEFAIFSIKKQVNLTSKSKDYLGLLLEELSVRIKYRDFLDQAIREISNNFGPYMTIYKDTSGQEYLHLRDIDTTAMQLVKVNGEIVTFRKFVPSRLSEYKVKPKRVFS